MKLNVLIIGGGSSLGLGLSENLVSSGHNIFVVTGKRSLSLKKREDIHFFYNSLQEPKDIEKTVNQITNYCAQFDIVFYNIGGGLGLTDPMISYTDFTKLLWFNFGIVQEFNRFILPKIRNSGKIICVGSIATRQIVGSLGYTLAKTALEQYVRFLGKELLKQGVSIMAISIGAYFEKGNAMDRLRKKKPDVFQDFINNRLPRKRMATTDEIVSFLAYLCNQESSIFSGSVIAMDGAETNSL